MGVNKGSLVHEVTIQQLTDSVGGSGFPVSAWTTLQTAWLCRETQTGREQFEAAQTSAVSVTRWEMEYVESMDPDLVDVPKKRRLVYQGRSYDIVQAQHVGRRERIKLTTVAGSKVEAA